MPGASFVGNLPRLPGIPISFAATWAVSHVTPAPSREMRDFVLRLRVPKGGQLMEQTH